jgi:hypothetical protein
MMRKATFIPCGDDEGDEDDGSYVPPIAKVIPSRPTDPKPSRTPFFNSCVI